MINFMTAVIISNRCILQDACVYDMPSCTRGPHHAAPLPLHADPVLKVDSRTPTSGAADLHTNYFFVCKLLLAVVVSFLSTEPVPTKHSAHFRFLGSISS